MKAMSNREFKKKLIKLTPLEPYFLGGYRIHVIEDGNRHYYIHSQHTPAQTTLFGVLRYIAIENPRSNADFRKRHADYHKKRKDGEFKREYHSYTLNRPDVSFNGITISPLYLVDENNCFYIPVPSDHKVGEEYYSPFSLSGTPIKTNNGWRRFPTDYDAKNGIASGWLALDGTRRIRTDLFNPAPQIGIDKYNNEQAFFKKEYIRLEKGFSFAFFADIGMELYNRRVFMGQQKSSFRAEWNDDSEIVTEPTIPADLFRNGMVYAQSDIYIGEITYPQNLHNECKNSDNNKQSIKKLYGECEFVCVRTRNHRIFRHNNLDRKGSNDIKLIQAGSVFLPRNIEAFRDIVHNKHAEIAGFNRIIVGGVRNENTPI